MKSGGDCKAQWALGQRRRIILQAQRAIKGSLIFVILGSQSVTLGICERCCTSSPRPRIQWSSEERTAIRQCPRTPASIAFTDLIAAAAAAKYHCRRGAAPTTGLGPVAKNFAEQHNYMA